MTADNACGTRGLSAAPANQPSRFFNPHQFGRRACAHAIFDLIGNAAGILRRPFQDRIGANFA